jgi:hypothetical protein
MHCLDSANRNQESIAAMFFARARQNEQSLQSTTKNINVIKGRTTIISANDDSNWWTMDDELDVMTISHTTLMYMSAKTGTLRILSPMATPLSLIMNAVQSHFFYGRIKPCFYFLLQSKLSIYFY